VQEKHGQAWSRRQRFPGTEVYDHLAIIDFSLRGRTKNILKARQADSAALPRPRRREHAWGMRGRKYGVRARMIFVSYL